MNKEGIIDQKTDGKKEKKAYEAPSFRSNKPLDHVSAYVYYYYYYY